MKAAVLRPIGFNGINMALGAWLIISPFVLGFAHHSIPEWNNIGVGIAILVVALLGVPWLDAVLAVWTMGSSFTLGFADLPQLVWNNLIVGVVALFIGISAASKRTVDAVPEEPSAP
jgi:hypothetical protein